MAVATTILVGLAIAGTAASLYAADTQANQQEANLKFQAAQSAADAKAAAGAAQVEAMRIRKAAKAQRAEATASAAASGIDVNSPTAIKIDETITKNAEEDAYLTILNGNNSAARLNQQSAYDRAGASIVRSNNRMNQGSLLLSGAANAYSGWKRAGA